MLRYASASNWPIVQAMILVLSGVLGLRWVRCHERTGCMCASSLQRIVAGVGIGFGIGIGSRLAVLAVAGGSGMMGHRLPSNHPPWRSACSDVNGLGSFVFCFEYGLVVLVMNLIVCCGVECVLMWWIGFVFVIVLCMKNTEVKRKERLIFESTSRKQPSAGAAA